jgi:hypothetical protein
MTPEHMSEQLRLPSDTCIEWAYPALRTGWRGVLDKSAGPGLTTAEVRFSMLALVLAPAALLLAECSGVLGVRWTLLQLLTGCFLALNVAFVVVVASGACKRWYHRDGNIQGPALALVLADGLFQLGLANAVFAWGEAQYFAYLGGYFVLGGLAIPRVPLYLRRSASLLFCFGGMLVAFYLAPVIRGLEWFPVIFFLKYFVAHIPREEPYRPASARA